MNWREWQRMQRLTEMGDSFVSYVDEGSGPPVVLLHGIPTWGYLWHQQLPALSRSCRVLAPDLLGYGFSDKREGIDRSIRRQAAAIDAWLEFLGIEGATVVGHDIGGGVAQILALRYPQRVARLCLINSVCYDSWPVEMVLQLGHPDMNKRVSAAVLQRLLRLSLGRMGFSSRAAASASLEGLLAPWATEVGARSLSRNAAALDPNQTLELVPQLARITVPCMILWGVDDTAFQPVRWGERLAWDIPSAGLVRLERAKHFAMLDRPDEVNAALLAFMTGSQPGLGREERQALH